MNNNRTDDITLEIDGRTYTLPRPATRLEIYLLSLCRILADQARDDTDTEAGS